MKDSLDAIYNLEYNTEREHLIIPEYGRHVQKMITHAKTITDNTERNKMAKAIIAVMGNLQPHLRDVPDFQHKLWDQLFIMSNFELHVDSPYPKPTKELFRASPDPLKYPQSHPKYRFYGNHIKTMVDIANTWETGDMKEALVYTIANHMKKSFLCWNKDTVDDSVIFNHLFDLSDGKIDLRNDSESLLDAASLLKFKGKFGNGNNANTKNTKKTHKKGNNRQRKRY